MRIGLRIDVDTLRGTRLGVPELCRTLARLGARGSFFFSMGPDNMGRHLWRLARPAFLWKMLRTRAPKLYGWEVVLRGTFGPGPMIGERAAAPIREAAAQGHEIGLHAWDHHAWQSRIDRMGPAEIRDHLERGARLLEALIGSPPGCSAAPAWRTTEAAVREKLRLPFAYNSDCRGASVFRPLLADGTAGQLQVPATLPTFDEVVGRDGASPEDYYDGLLAQLAPDGLNVLTLHAEVEGILARELFERFAEAALARGYRFVPLGELAGEAHDPPFGRLGRREVPGREGWVSWQEGAAS